MKIKYKKLDQFSKGITKAHEHDAGFDLYATTKQEATMNNAGLYTEYGTGVCFDIPKGYVGLLFPRSSVYKTGQYLTNSVGVIDSGYRGEIMLKFTRPAIDSQYKVGDRVGQLIIMPYPQVRFEEVKDLNATDRGVGGFGSTGN